MFLTKSDFKAARTCPTKLYYKKLRFPSLLDDDPYLEFLADGGYMVEAMAKLLFPDGQELGNWKEPQRAFQKVCTTLNSGNVTLFEATIIHNNLLARIDILRRDGNTLHVIEVKSSSFNSAENGQNPFRGKKGGILSDWKEYLEDVTFQALVLQRAFPAYEVIPFLCIVDKAKKATENVVFDKFRLHRQKNGEGLSRPQVEYIGDVVKLRAEHVLEVINVTSEVGELISEVSEAADRLALTLLNEPIIHVAPVIGQVCKGCEYRSTNIDGQPNGFKECWGSLSSAEPHVLNLYRVDLLGGKKRDVVAELAAAGEARLTEIPDDCLQGVVAERQRIQIQYSRDRREYISSNLPTILADHAYPLHFVDFEGSRIAIPFHVGMHPYEQASFQWSCHTIKTPNAETVHTEWLNVNEAFPNFEFARSLRNQIGDQGTVYIWSHYEVDVLREIRRQMNDYNENDPSLAAWLESMAIEKNPRIVDLCAVAKDHYFHPVMNGSLSIKYAIRAAWTDNTELREKVLFAEYVKFDADGHVLDPYMSLPPLPIGGKEDVVREGTGAMRIYQEMMFGLAKDDPMLRETYRRLLLQYCKLDTLAMVFLWMHWYSGIRK